MIEYRSSAWKGVAWMVAYRFKESRMGSSVESAG